MRYIYTAVISPGENEAGKYYARVPDVPGCITSGWGIDDTIFQITDALSGCLTVMEDLGVPVHAPTPQHKIPHGEEDILTLISVDTNVYRAQTDTFAIQKNVSIPSQMTNRAD